MEEATRHIVLMRSIAQLLQRAEAVQSEVLQGEIWVLPGALSHLEQKHADQLDKSISALLELWAQFARCSTLENTVEFVKQIEYGFFLLAANSHFKEVIEQQLEALFLELSEHELVTKQLEVLQTKTSPPFRARFAGVITRTLLQTADGSLESKVQELVMRHSSPCSMWPLVLGFISQLAFDDALFKRCREVLEKSLAHKLQNQIASSQKKSDKKVPALLQVIKFKVDAIQALILTVKQNGGTAGLTVHQLSQSVS